MFQMKSVYFIVLIALPALGIEHASVRFDNPSKDSHSLYASPLVHPNGNHMSLAQYANGKPIAVVVMKGTWCFVCSNAIERLDAMQDRWQSFGVEIVGLNSQSPAENLQHQKNLGTSIPIFSDPEGKLLQDIGFYLPQRDYPFPGVLFFDACGKWVHTIKGRSPARPQYKAVLSILQEIKKRPHGCGQITASVRSPLASPSPVALK